MTRGAESPEPAKGPTGGIDLKSLDPARLAAFVAGLGEPAYRARQIMRWLYERDEPDPAAWTDLPSALREKLDREARVTLLVEADRRVSGRDGTAKFLWRLEDSEAVESVAIPEGERLTVCFSTQVGCALRCTFCATGLGGFRRDLSAGEIVDQVLRMRAWAGRRVTNAVAMGQGEPFRNYEATLAALRILNSPEGLAIGARHLTVSTCGLISGVERFAREPEQFGLAVSLHSARQDVRDRLMPGVRRWHLPELRKACADYSRDTGRRVTFEYALILGTNDSEEDLEALIGFCRGLLCHVNLIPANPVAGSAAGRATKAQVHHFRGELMAVGVETSVRAERGADIDAACGQLRGASR
jgi:23S rRNA (adenine2503-C2)-methyltransferase